MLLPCNSLIISAVFRTFEKNLDDMTEIDKLRRIKLRDLKKLFDALAGVRDKLLPLWDSPDRWERAHSKVEAALQMEASFQSDYNPLTFKIQAKVNERAEIYCLFFRWKFEGKQREQRVWVRSRRSNLIEGAFCYYFVCPYTNRLCRKLYTDGEVLVSRYGFPHTYSERNYSHRWREEKRLLDLMEFIDDDGNFKGRRERYRGKLTPFGRKLRKMVGGDTLEEVSSQITAQIAALLATPSRRGRPRGGKSSSPPLFMK